jgi:hypothetical protein
VEEEEATASNSNGTGRRENGTITEETQQTSRPSEHQSTDVTSPCTVSVASCSPRSHSQPTQTAVSSHIHRRSLHDR